MMMMMMMADPGSARAPSAQDAAEAAVRAVGCGYDLTDDLRLFRAKTAAGRLLDLDPAGAVRELALPGGAVVRDVPAGIVADKGERARFRSDVLPFSQMAERVNQSLSVPGKIPSGPFNAMFDYRGCWQRDAAATRTLCFDARLVELYAVEAPRAWRLALREEVVRDVPTLWDPAALAAFIDRYGTHVVVGVRMGGKDVVCVKQLRGSALAPRDVQARLKKLADDVFSQDRRRETKSGGSSRAVPGPGSAAWRAFRSPVVFNKDDVVGIHVRRGGVDDGQSHNEWLTTVAGSPDVISMAFVPITSLLAGVPGRGFLNHAVNLYLRYKPPIEELEQFLEFQVPRQWAPEFGELLLTLGPQRKKKRNSLPSLQFTLMGPKLRVNTAKVDSGGRPVTGIRLFLEGKKNNRLGVHLQHLSASPGAITVVTGDAVYAGASAAAVNERAYFEPVRSPLLTHACTAPVQHNGARIDDCAAVVTAAWLEVREACLKKVLFLRLGFSGVARTKIRRSEWDGPLAVARKSGSLSAMFSAALSGTVQTTKPAEGKVEVNSAVFPKGPPVPLPVQRMAKYVDTTEVTRGPDDLPGYWVVTGAKLCVEGGKVGLKAKYSLLISVPEDDDA